LALAGDNVVAPSNRMAWYGGGSLLNHLERVHIASDRNLVDARFPVQYVIRPRSDEFHDYRGYAGQIASGTLRAGDDVVVLPSGMQTRIEYIDTAEGAMQEASAPSAVALRLADDLDVARGDLICRPGNQPYMMQDIDAMLCWMDIGRVAPGARLLLKHTTSSVRAQLREIVYRVDVNSLHRTEAESLGVNDIARVRLRTAQPIMCDDYKRNKTTGSFILIDPATSRTVAAGMVGPSQNLRSQMYGEGNHACACLRPALHRTAWSFCAAGTRGRYRNDRYHWQRNRSHGAHSAPTAARGGHRARPGRHVRSRTSSQAESGDNRTTAALRGAVDA
jgi:bifunctional enzyme CysN/CysC